MNAGSLKKELIELIEKDVEETLKSDKEVSFSWEIYFKFNLWSKCNTLVIEKLTKIIKEKSIEENKCVVDEIGEITENEEKNGEFQKSIDLIKQDLLKNGVLKYVSLKEKEASVVSFFKEKRNIDYNCLNEKEKYDLLVQEDISSSEDKIYLNLEITHMQYKYLYQVGSTLTQSN